MQQSNNRKQWYALQLKTRFEKVVAQHLRGKGYEEFLPTYRARRHWSDRINEIELPLFPGYIFCKFDVTQRLPLLMIPGVQTVVRCGGTLMPIPEQEIVAIQCVVGSGSQYGPWAGLSVGEAVQVKYGPLRGLEGVIVQVKEKHHLIISVHLLRRHVSVEIDMDSVVPLRQNRVAVVA
jgi:transcription termination/antitermination protein NusG